MEKYLIRCYNSGIPCCGVIGCSALNRIKRLPYISIESYHQTVKSAPMVFIQCNTDNNGEVLWHKLADGEDLLDVFIEGHGWTWYGRDTEKAKRILAWLAVNDHNDFIQHMVGV